MFSMFRQGRAIFQVVLCWLCMCVTESVVDRKLCEAASTEQSTPERWAPHPWWGRWVFVPDTDLSYTHCMNSNIVIWVCKLNTVQSILTARGLIKCGHAVHAESKQTILKMWNDCMLFSTWHLSVLAYLTSVLHGRYAMQVKCKHWKLPVLLMY